MANLVLIAAGSAIVLSIVFLVLYILYLFKRFFQLQHESMLQSENINIASLESNGDQGESDTATLISYVPLALLRKWATSPTSGKGTSKALSTEETSFFQLPSNPSYYKYSVVDETMSNEVISNESKDILRRSNARIVGEMTNHERKRNSVTGSSQILSVVTPIIGNRITRKNTWDFIRSYKISNNKNNLDYKNASSYSVAKRKQVRFSDINKVEKFLFGKHRTGEEKEFLI